MENSSHNGQDIYNLTLQVFLERSKSIDKFSQRLLTIAGFNALFINFSLQLSSEYLSLILTKTIAIFLFILSITACICGIIPQDSGDIYTGRNLVENLWNDSKEVFYVTIIEQLEKAIDQISKIIKIKQKSIKTALYFTFAGIIFFGFNIILTSIIQYLCHLK